MVGTVDAFGGHVPLAAELGEHLGGRRALAIEDFGRAGRLAQELSQISLLQARNFHLLANGVNRIGRLDRTVLQ